MITSVENLKDLTKKNLLELISDYNKVAGCKVNIQISTTFLYISNEQAEFQSKSTMPLELFQNELLSGKN